MNGKSGSILVFGYVDDTVIEALDEKGITYTTMGKGDKYEDNIEMVSDLCENYGCNRLLFTDYRSVEDTIIKSEYPVIIIAYTVPEITKDLIKDHMDAELGGGILVVPDYLQAMYDAKMDIRADTGENFSILVKMGKVSPGGEGV